MATVKLVSYQEQNANALAGAQFDTAVYATAAGGGVTLRVGRDAPLHVVAGTQTAVTAVVVLDLVNAYHGAQITVKRGTQGNSTSVINVVSGSGAGVVIGQLNSSAIGQVVSAFDGANNIWR